MRREAVGHPAPDVRAVGLTADVVTTRISGSGDVDLTGTADEQRATLEGSGDYRAGALATRAAEVVLSGSGDATVDVSGTLRADVSGSGSVTHTGGASVTGSVTGSGDVRRG